jgi:hypothetical protein
MDEANGYPDLLRAAIDAAGSSRRKLSFYLADMTGNKQTSEYRALGKYLSGEEIPSADRAAILAVALTEPRLALVADSRARRQGRLSELEGDLERLRREHESFVRAATERMAHLEEDLGTTRRRSGRAS